MKLTKYLEGRTTYVFLTIIFKACLLPSLRLATTCTKIGTFIEHKEVVKICEESGPIGLSYNVFLTTPEANIVLKPIILIVTAKSTLIYTNCGKIDHSLETYHNMKKEVLVVPIAIVKSTKHVVETKTPLVKISRIHVRYPCIICSHVEHRFGECPKKIEVQNMFKIKPISSNAMITPKPPKTKNVLVNVVVIVTIDN